MSVLEFNQVHRSFDRSKEVLKGVDFSVKKGEVVGLLGRNGAGKTTLLNIALGLIRCHGGSVNVFGEDPREKPVEVKRRIGFVSEDQILPDYMRVDEVIDLHRRLFPTWDTEFEAELMGRFDINRSARIETLSKGEARRVALVCAMAHRPELLLLDEPAGGLDPLARREFLETAIRFLSDTGSTIVFSSHHMADVERMAQRVVLINEGAVLLDEDTDDLREVHSIALVAKSDGIGRRDLLGLESCLAVRERKDSFHAVFALEPVQAHEVITNELGATTSQCQSVDLEEMFIELVGGQP
jgi:ABC-2 type transport system ATP-binding protein